MLHPENCDLFLSGLYGSICRTDVCITTFRKGGVSKILGENLSSSNELDEQK